MAALTASYNLDNADRIQLGGDQWLVVVGRGQRWVYRNQHRQADAECEYDNGVEQFFVHRYSEAGRQDDGKGLVRKP